ncbi:MAG: aminoacyl-tRNA hydrolase [Lentisphaeria bacterium]|nr:aminoacyl-tRNA hydrolase [Lentisphaeria bacterium]
MANDFSGRVMIVGLGNPGSEYAHTRHNVGFDVLDILAEKMPKKNFVQIHGCSSHYLKGTYAGHPLFLQKPETYMNLSGDAVSALMKREGIGPENLLIVYDDMDLELGKLRIREKGSSGGHNGIRSIISSIGTESFARIRIGIGHRNERSGADFVLSRFEPDDQKIMDRVMTAAADALIMILRRGIKQAMNQFNPLDLSVETDEE